MARVTPEGGLPNFIIVGVAKAGTTSLFHYLAQHPDIYMSPVKEPRFFAFEAGPPEFRGPRDEQVRKRATRTLDGYRRLFGGVRGERAVGEASVVYLPHRGSAAAIARRIPDAKIVALLRDPVERAYSAYLYYRRDGIEPCATFEEALAAEPRRIRDGWYYHWHYRDQGFYHRNLADYYDHFPAERIRVFLHDDLHRDPHGTLGDVFRFLDVDGAFRADVRIRHNPSCVSGSPRVHRVLTRRHPLKEALKKVVPEQWGHRAISLVMPANGEKPPVSPETRTELVAGYEDDLRQLERRTGRDLSAWLRRD